MAKFCWAAEWPPRDYGEDQDYFFGLADKLGIPRSEVDPWRESQGDGRIFYGVRISERMRLAGEDAGIFLPAGKVLCSECEIEARYDHLNGRSVRSVPILERGEELRMHYEQAHPGFPWQVN